MDLLAFLYIMLYQNYKKYLGKMIRKTLLYKFPVITRGLHLKAKLRSVYKMSTSVFCKMLINYKWALVLPILLMSLYNSAFADSQSYGPIIQRQSKQIQELKGRVLELENSIEEIKSILKKTYSVSHQIAETPGKSPSNFEENNTAEAILSEDTDKNFFDDKPSSSEPQDKVDYDLALATLKEGDFALAETKFADFIKKYPSSRLQSNAIFWYAEIFYREGNYNKAAINYLQCYKKYPKGSKASDALLKLAYSLASLNKNKEACSMLDKLEAEFPNRPISSIKRAKEAWAQFRCK